MPWRCGSKSWFPRHTIAVGSARLAAMATSRVDSTSVPDDRLALVQRDLCLTHVRCAVTQRSVKNEQVSPATDTRTLWRVAGNQIKSSHTMKVCGGCDSRTRTPLLHLGAGRHHQTEPVTHWKRGREWHRLRTQEDLGCKLHHAQTQTRSNGFTWGCNILPGKKQGGDLLDPTDATLRRQHTEGNVG